MAPPKQPQPPFQKDERVLCFHMEMLYEAKILDVMPGENGEGWQYKIHYKGWKSSWDDWVPQDRVRKFTDENKDLASQLLAQFKMLQSGKTAKQPKKGARATGSDMSSARGSEERTAGTTTASGRGPRRARDFDLEHEDNFHNRPSIKLPLPDHLKAILVDDWENVTKLQQLVPLPHAHPVEEILGDYLAHERPNRQEGSASMDILEETVAGLREYFDKALGRILLYRFERAQYHEMHQLWNSDESKQKNAGDTYGAEHLARLLVSLPELVAQTNMDQQSVNRLREELMKFTNWFSRQVTKYFVSEYETPAADYHEKARSA
ncbi:Chromatin modification-related protein eaf3 [Madurella mycetomatis]|uniref:Chromatin modification-related protein EAF3 n=1 Tax=Madurella mycetomatis TaxID=100816 RepID=A0A175W8S0_9PEZI|nr:Chromatin modification-related protein eaf3 [Madurella mycetomatis]